MKQFYTQYAMHCIRLYVRVPRDKLRTDVDRENWDAVERVFLNITDYQKDLITYCFKPSAEDTNQVVKKYAQLAGVDQVKVTATINYVTKLVAIERNLI